MIHDEKHHEPTEDERQNAKKGKKKESGSPNNCASRNLGKMRLKERTKTTTHQA
jgi:hypothetical protein